MDKKVFEANGKPLNTFNIFLYLVKLKAFVIKIWGKGEKALYN